MKNKKQASMQSLGGKTAAKNMTPEQRKERAMKAADGRWGIPKVTHKGDLDLKGVVLPCYVLEDGRRVISGNAMQLALGMVDEDEEKPSGTRLGRYLSQKSLQPFIYIGKEEGHFNPIECRHGVSKINGYEATVLVDLCEAFLKAREDIKLSPRQAYIAKKCEILVTAFAKTGIVALVDEATGYQDIRAKDALAKILEQYIADEHRKWTECFPERFYKEMFRLRNWDWTEKSIAGKRPGVVGRYTDDIVYERLAPQVLVELRKKNPTIKAGRRKHKHYHWLTGEVGHPKLLAHLEGVTLLMRQSKTWDELKEKLDEYYPIHEIDDLGMPVNVKRPKIGSKRMNFLD